MSKSQRGVIMILLALAMYDQSAHVRADDAPIEPTAIVPILMYHHVQDLPATADEVTRTWTVATADFHAQMRLLGQLGYQTITLQQLVDHFTHAAALPDKPVIITFDDGWDVGYSTVFPMLKSLHLSGTFFVCPGSIGDRPGGGYLTWDQLREMLAAGMDVQSHTMSHPHLRDVAPDVQQQEIIQSKRVLETRLNRPIVALAYPFGQFNERVIQIVNDAGYQCAVTIEPGLRQRWSERFSLRRIRISYGDTLDTFREQITFP